MELHRQHLLKTNETKRPGNLLAEVMDTVRRGVIFSYIRLVETPWVAPAGPDKNKKLL